jgi:hypothetical protein
MTNGGRNDDHSRAHLRDSIDWDLAMMATQKIGYDGPLISRVPIPAPAVTS